MTVTKPFDPFNLLPKHAVGFDEVLNRLTELTSSMPKIPNFPPYNIKKTGDNTYVIEIAVAGFGKQDIELTIADGVLTVKGQVTTDEATDYIFKGIADRAFTRKFTLADTVEVKNADLINGMLKIWLERFVPESKKPKKIDINEINKHTSDIETEKKHFLAEKSGA